MTPLRSVPSTVLDYRENCYYCWPMNDRRGTDNQAKTRRVSFGTRIGMCAAVLLWSLCLSPWPSQGHGCDPEGQPFYPGERLTFMVTWGAIPVGEGVLEVMPPSEVNGLEARHFVMTTRTNAFADVFYRVRDRMEGFTDREMTRSLLYTKTSGGKSKRDVVVAYDWNEMRSRYFNRGEEHASVSLLPGSFDPLSMFFAFRFFDIDVGKELAIPVSDGKKTITGRAVVIERGVINVRGVDYETFLVRVDMGDVDGVFKKSRDADLFVWVTTDDRRMPVRMRSSVAVGSFTVDLVHDQPGHHCIPENSAGSSR